MKKPILFIFFLCSFLFIDRFAIAEVNVADSLEWMTVDSEIIVVGHVDKVKRFHGDGDQIYEDVTVHVSDSLKGDYKENSIDFRRMTYRSRLSKTGFKKDNHRMLFFLIKGDPERAEGRYKDRWVLRSEREGLIDLESFGALAFSADMQILSDPKQIIQIVQKRVKYRKENPNRAWINTNWLSWNYTNLKSNILFVAISQQNSYHVSVPWGTELHGVLFRGSWCYLVLPADKDIVLELANSKNFFNKRFGAEVLRYYPDENVVETLKKLLKDETTYAYSVFGIVYNIEYPVRIAAYSSLISLGIDVKKPMLEENPKGMKIEEYSRKSFAKNRYSFYSKGWPPFNGQKMKVF